MNTEIIGKTIAGVTTETDRHGRHLNIDFTDGSSAGFSFMWPENLTMQFAAAFWQSKESDSEPMIVKRRKP